MAEVCSLPELRGNPEDPISGRAWVRTFADGQAELLYLSGNAPGQVERFNVWCADAGLDTRVTSFRQWPGIARDDRAELTPEDNAERAARRARQRIRWSAKAIGADQMLTLTVRENLSDRARVRAAFQRWTVYVKRIYPAFRWVAVDEQQERGAWHWHVAVRGFYAYGLLRWCWYRALGVRCKLVNGEPAVSPELTPGNVDGRVCHRRRRAGGRWTADLVAAYMVKYIVKGIGHEATGEARYSVSRGLVWKCDRYVIRGLTFSGVAAAVLALRVEVGLQAPVVFQPQGGACLWMAGALEPRPPDR